MLKPTTRKANDSPPLQSLGSMRGVEAGKDIVRCPP
jgi:hypothetical protein